LVGTPLLHAKALHLLATPDGVRVITLEIQNLRTGHGLNERPLIVWEPLPVACKQDNRQSFLDACRFVDVFSPNHLEIAALFESEPNGYQPERLKSYAQRFLEHSVGPFGQGTIVIRAGKHGSLSVSRSIQPCWLPAYYPDGSPQVVDPTGAGNAYLGGYMMGWHRTKNIVEASIYGNVAASFALEQIGLPECKQQGDEAWNGVRVVGRLHAYKERLGIPDLS
jgi:sugar/nucleoside kinase (ribokinase family)